MTDDTPTPTKVIFRQFPEGDIIALFPEVVASPSPWECQSYQHLGQHGSAYPEDVISGTIPAPDSPELADLAAELTALGYRLDVRRRITPQMRDVHAAAHRDIYRRQS
jgi:hypothetical protein